MNVGMRFDDYYYFSQWKNLLPAVTDLVVRV
jgi:hypothetical protein